MELLKTIAPPPFFLLEVLFKCVNGWTAYGGSCYKFYLVANPKGSTWYESESYCVEAG